jgi:hypothetical protein
MITEERAAEIFRTHVRELVRAARRGAPGRRVLAEVAGDGAWQGAGVVTRGTGSLLAHEGRGYALYVSCHRFFSLADGLQAIDEWEEEARR